MSFAFSEWFMQFYLENILKSDSLSSMLSWKLINHCRREQTRSHTLTHAHKLTHTISHAHTLYARTHEAMQALTIIYTQINKMMQTNTTNAQSHIHIHTRRKIPVHIHNWIGHTRPKNTCVYLYLNRATRRKNACVYLYLHKGTHMLMYSHTTACMHIFTRVTTYANVHLNSLSRTHIKHILS